MNGFIKRSAGLFALGAFVSGCAVGPDFHTPAAPDVIKYNAHPLPARTASTASAKGNSGISQIYVYNRDIPAEWWQLFRSPAIDELVRSGMANSPTLAAAQSALRQTEENFYAGIGNLLFPALDANMQAQRQRFAAASVGFGSSSTIFNLFNANAAVTYTLDIFGGSRREIESLRAQVDYQQFQLLATYLALTSNIVTTAFTIASLEAQIKATESIIQSQAGQLNILQKQLRLGGIASTTVFTQQTLVDQTRASLPPLQKLLSQSRHALATLIGVYPDTPMPEINLNTIKLPAEIPVSLPSQLVRQRPDVRSSEALLHVASAQIGVATANLFPQITIMGNDGWTSSIASSLFQPGSQTWALAGQLAQPIFHGGALFAQRRGAIAAYDQALAQYKQTILLAFQNTADSLRALETDARTYRASRAAELAAFQNYRITRTQFRDGGVAYINLLNAQQQYQQTRIASIQAQAMRYADVAALYQSLGGGWWNRKFIQCPDKQINPEHATLNCP